MLADSLARRSSAVLLKPAVMVRCQGTPIALKRTVNQDPVIQDFLMGIMSVRHKFAR